MYYIVTVHNLKVEYDNMVKSRVGQPIYTGNPIQDMMNGMGGFAR